jgi:large subunit ribosomal protein L24
MDIKKGDAVKIIAGKYKGQHGTVLSAHPSVNKITVDGINLATKHVRARKADEKSGIVSEPAPFDASNAMVICPVCVKATRINNVIGEDGKKARFCKKCGANIDANTAKRKATVKKAKKASKKEKAENADSDK